MVSEEKVREALKEVDDPELGMNLVDLGLIYDIEVEDGDRVRITMSLTTPNCARAETMPGMVRAAAEAAGARRAEVDLVDEPRWTPERMSEEAKEVFRKAGFPV